MNLTCRRPPGWDAKAHNTCSEYDVYLGSECVGSVWESFPGWAWKIADGSAEQTGWSVPETRKDALWAMAMELRRQGREVQVPA